MRNLIEKHGRGKIFGISYCVLAVVLVAYILLCYNLNHNYNYKGHKLKLTAVQKNGVYMRDTGGNMLFMEVVSIDKNLFDKEYIINYLGETIKYTSKIKVDNTTYIFSDGSKYIEPRSYTNLNDPTKKLTKSQLSEKLLVSKLIYYYNEYGRISGIFYFAYAFFGLLFLLLGTAEFFYPEVFWRLHTMYIIKDGEPTDYAIFCNKLGGAMLTIGTFIFLLFITQ